MNNNLYVVTCISNPVRYHSRYALYKDFEKRMKDAGVILYTVELAFGDRPFEITQSDNPHHVQVRSFFELWHKENMLNLGIQRLPNDWEYVAWIDADIQFTHPNWVNETIEQLQHYMIVQMFSHSIDLDPNYAPMHTYTGFVYNYYHKIKEIDNGYSKYFGHPGYAWAARREALDAVGGLIDEAILGAADMHMACALVGKATSSYNGLVHPEYKNMCLRWQERANKFIKKDIGYVPGQINHFWHGAKADRRYQDRWKILVDNKFNPVTDIYPDSQGLIQLNPDRIKLRDDVRKYFRSRFEDSDWTGKPHKMLP